MDASTAESPSAEPPLAGSEVRHAGLNLLRLIAALGLGVVISVLLARGLGPEGRGLYALAALLPFLLERVFALGLGPAAAVFTAREPTRGAAVARAVTGLAGRLGLLAAGAGAAVALLLGDALFPGVPRGALLAAALVAPVLIIAAALQGVLQGRRDFRAFNLVRLVPHVGLLLAVPVAVWVLDLGVTGAVGALAVAQVATLVASALAVGRRRPAAGEGGSGPPARDLLLFGARHHAAGLLVHLVQRSGLVVLNLLAGAGPAGLLAVATTFAERLAIPALAAGDALLPRIAGASADPAERRDATAFLARLVLGTGVVAAAVLYAVADPLVPLLFSDAFAGAVAPLRALLPGAAVFGLAHLLGDDLAGRGRPGLAAAQAAVALVVHAVGLWWLAPAHGATGCAAAASGAIATLALLRTITFLRLSGAGAASVLLPHPRDAVRAIALLRGRDPAAG